MMAATHHLADDHAADKPSRRARGHADTRTAEAAAVHRLAVHRDRGLAVDWLPWVALVSRRGVADGGFAIKRARLVLLLLLHAKAANAEDEQEEEEKPPRTVGHTAAATFCRDVVMRGTHGAAVALRDVRRVGADEAHVAPHARRAHRTAARRRAGAADARHPVEALQAVAAVAALGAAGREEQPAVLAGDGVRRVREILLDVGGPHREEQGAEAEHVQTA
mmetsp:Transcript_15640/g.46332  ORF Transcript_15640/g.46332 Transcript_15640/m.46332 type:complete len:221 (+) Transcript_15640:427-1089(+)